MPHVDAARGIGEHLHAEILGLVRVFLYLIGARLIPALLPARLHLGRIVSIIKLVAVLVHGVKRLPPPLQTGGIKKVVQQSLLKAGCTYLSQGKALVNRGGVAVMGLEERKIAEERLKAFAYNSSASLPFGNYTSN